MRLWLALLLAPAVSGAPWDGCRELRDHGKLAEATACFSKLLSERDALTRAEALWGLGGTRMPTWSFAPRRRARRTPPW